MVNLFVGVHRMIKLYDKHTGEHIGNAIKYDGKNKVEFNMFGVTGTTEGRKTKIDCQGVPHVHTGKIFERVKNSYYVVQQGILFDQMSTTSLMAQFDFEER